MKTAFLTTLGLLLAGCAAPYTEAPPPDDHPANPTAAGSALPQRSRTLELSLADPVTTRPTPAPMHEMGTGAAHESQAGSSAIGESTGAESYTCPMHPEVVSKEAGRCPKCSMKLVPKKKEGAQE